MSPRICKEDTQRVLTQNPLSNCVNRFLSTPEICLSERCRSTTSLSSLALNSFMLFHRILDWAFPFTFYEQRGWPNRKAIPREAAVLSFKTVNRFFNQNFPLIFVISIINRKYQWQMQDTSQKSRGKTVKNQARTFSFPGKGLGNIIISLKAAAICYAL